MKYSRSVTYIVGLFFAAGLHLISQQSNTPTAEDGSLLHVHQTDVCLPGSDPAALFVTSGNSAEPKFVGTNACVHCHKDGHDFPSHAVAGKEYTIWANKDRHSCAYNMLFEKRSLDIARNLKLTTPPHKNDLCLNCHATNVEPEQLTSDHEFTLVDGVGCESCHGAAEQWLVPHKLPEWNFLSPSQKESLGFVNTDNLAGRARKCVECHVGSPGRDVNHDLIAAGHPRLYFELAAYQAKMPRHWSREKELQQNSVTAEARTWLVGRFASAAAAIELLEQRAHDESAPWPEFSEYGCFSCHHDLAEQRSSAANQVFQFVKSKPSWNTWHFSMLSDIAASGDKESTDPLVSNIRRLRDAMQEKLPDRKSIIEITSQIKQSFHDAATLLSDSELPQPLVLATAQQLLLQENGEDDLNWELLTQRYLAAVALRQSLMDARWVEGSFSSVDFDNSAQRLVEIRDSLKFIEDYEGPRALDREQQTRINQSFSEIFGLSQ